ncbi:hypothetical protein [Gordonia rhizosphera]|uniref:Uncharacterized protein n=1 Tax=Gordonia rhizosphera NBRC 16068 TaxID=1108045 RepID=K6VZR7_9ACTN|nr:hypothetical protein [Gordonia rhizosphera]GAB92400.1 hypothetical protein GORHZ_174_00010 [Gordonia rhizosphera NBRC 16068]
MTDVTSRECMWCSSDEDVADFRDEPRCGRCRTAEQAIAEAREFVGFYGLRPLGGSVESDDDEEREHRVAAREASAELTRIRTHTPSRGTSRSRQRVSATRSASTATKTAGKAATGKAQSALPGVTRPSGISRPDHAELTSRAEGLLAQLTEIEERLAVAQKDSGLSGKAKVSDLTAKRDFVLRTLAALEKAKRALEPA